MHILHARLRTTVCGNDFRFPYASLDKVQNRSAVQSVNLHRDAGLPLIRLRDYATRVNDLIRQTASDVCDES